MRITTQGQSLDAVTSNIKSDVATKSSEQLIVEKQEVQGEDQLVSKDKLQQAVQTVNEFLQINHSSSKFVLHDGLDRYFVQVVDAQTEEVVKEIPPRKLLDAFYEMQKLLGMIVDEKI